MRGARALVLSALLLGAGSHAKDGAVSFTEAYPVGTAFEDGAWTLLERVMPWGEVYSTRIPSTWMPTQLGDYDSVTVTIERGTDEATLTIRRIGNPKARP